MEDKRYVEYEPEIRTPKEAELEEEVRILRERIKALETTIKVLRFEMYGK